MDTTTLVAALAALAAFNERLLEHTLGRWGKPSINTIIPFAALVLGVVEAVAFKLNALPAEWGVPILVAQVVTGVALGMGSNVVHLFMGKVVK